MLICILTKNVITSCSFIFFFFNHPSPTDIYTLSLHDALPISTVIELDRDVVLKDLVPALVDRHFSPHDETAYRVAIVNRSTARVLYSSAGDWTSQDLATPDEIGRAHV